MVRRYNQREPEKKFSPMMTLISFYAKMNISIWISPFPKVPVTSFFALWVTMCPIMPIR